MAGSSEAKAQTQRGRQKSNRRCTKKAMGR